jgi:hypothetical protein
VRLSFTSLPLKNAFVNGVSYAGLLPPANQNIISYYPPFLLMQIYNKIRAIHIKPPNAHPPSSIFAFCHLVNAFSTG